MPPLPPGKHYNELITLSRDTPPRVARRQTFVFDDSEAAEDALDRARGHLDAILHQYDAALAKAIQVIRTDLFHKGPAETKKIFSNWIEQVIVGEAERIDEVVVDNKDCQCEELNQMKRVVTVAGEFVGDSRRWLQNSPDVSSEEAMGRIERFFSDYSHAVAPAVDPDVKKEQP